MEKKLLKNEVCFVNIIGLLLSDQLSDDQKKELEQLFIFDYGALVKAANRYMVCTIKAIKNGCMSMEGFTVQDAENFGIFLGCNKLDEQLRNEFSHLLYGANERERYFEK